MIAQLLLALLPIAGLIGLGSWLRHHQFLSEAFWPSAERLSYYILLPSLFVYSLATAKLDEVPVLGMLGVLVLPILAVAGVLLLARPRLVVGDAAFTSIFQGGVRFNNYVGVSAAAGLFGAQGVALAAVANAVSVPTVNLLCVLVFAHYAGGSLSLRGVLRQLALNPLLMACVIGIALQVSGLGLAPGLDSFLKTLGSAALPLGLLCIGAALDFSAVRSWLRPVGVSSLYKFLLMPLATLLACRLFGLEGPAAITALIFQALPTASSSYIMARQLGGDAPLMAGIIAGQTVLASVTLPIAVLGLSALLPGA